MCEVIGILLILGFFVTVIGHGLWVLFARVFSNHFEYPDETPPSASPPCPVCGRRLKYVNGRCPDCGCDSSGEPSSSPLRELTELQQRVNRLETHGILSREQQAELLKVISPEVSRLRLPPIITPEKPAAPARKKELEEAMELVFDDSPPAAQPVGIVKEPVRETVPSEPLANVLHAFMEEKNIRWGELTSGMLIVGSSIGLVISLWATLRDAIPYFPALLFLLGTAAIHGAGVYTLKKWKLRSTSRGLLVIASLLIPLNYLAAIALSEQRPISDPLYLASISIGTLAFGCMAWFSGRELLLRGPALLVVALLGTSTGQLIIARQAKPELSISQLALLTAVPFGCFLLTTIGQLGMAVRWQRLTMRRTGQIFLVLGISTFSLLVSMGLIGWKCQHLRETFADLAPSFSLALVPILGLGLLIQQRATALPLVGRRTAGTTVALFAAALMLMALAFTWPRPELLFTVAVIDFIALTALAVAGRFPVLHGPALAAIALAGLLGYHISTGTIAIDAVPSGERLVGALLMGRSAVLLTGLSLLVAVVAGLLHRFKRPGDSTAYLFSAATLATLSAGIAAYAGFSPYGVDRHLATPVFAVAAAVLLIAAYRIRRSPLVWLGSGFVLITFVHGLSWNERIITALDGWHLLPQMPGVVAMLLHATVCCVISFFVWRKPKPVGTTDDTTGLWYGLTQPLSLTALFTSALALPMVLLASRDSLGVHASYGFWIAVVWTAIAFLWESRLLFAAAQSVGTIALGFATTFFCMRHSWWAGALLDPRHLQAQMAVLAVWAMVWTLFRKACGNQRRIHVLYADGWTTVDRVLLGVLACGSVALVATGCLPGIAGEFAIASRNAASAGIHPLGIIVILLLTGGLVVAATLALIAKRRIAVFSGLSALTAAWALPFWDRLAVSFWETVDVSHTLAYGPGAWLVLACVCVGIIVACWERFSPALFAGLLVASLSVPLLLAGPFETQQATASALRWFLAIHGVIIALLICARGRLTAALKNYSPHIVQKIPSFSVGVIRSLAITATITPVLAMTLRQLILYAQPGLELTGPLDGSFFGGMGAAFSVAGPLVMIAAVFAMYAVRERSPHFALAGAYSLNLAVCAAVALVQWASGASMTIAFLVEYFQWHAIAASGSALVCVTARGWIEPVRPEDNWSAFKLASPIGFQVFLGNLSAGLLAAWSVVVIVAVPSILSSAIPVLGAPLSYISLVFAAGASLRYFRQKHPFSTLHLAAGVCMAATGLIAASCSGWNSAEDWFSYHMLVTGWTALSALAAAAACFITYYHRPDESSSETSFARVVSPAVGWSSIVGGLVVLLSIRGLWTDPARPWWSVVPVGITALVAGGLALRGRNQLYAYASTLLVMLATAFVWLRPWLGVGISPTSDSSVALIQSGLIAMILAGVVWAAVEVWWQRRFGSTFDSHFSAPPVHHTAAGLGLMVQFCAVAYGLLVQWTGIVSAESMPDLSNAGAWFAVAGMTVLLIGSLWDHTAKHVEAGFYTLGLVIVGLILHGMELSPRNLTFRFGLALAGYVLLTGAVWRLRNHLTAIGQQWGITQVVQIPNRAALWLSSVTLLLSAVVVVIEFWVVLSFAELPLRLYGTAAVGVTALGVLAFGQEKRQSAFQLLTLLLVAVCAADLGWGIMDVEQMAHIGLHRAIRLLVMVSLTTFAYGSVLVRCVPRTGTWFTSARRAAAIVGGVSLAVLLIVLGMEAFWFDALEGAPVSITQTLIVAAVLCALAGTLISMAALPGKDPLGLSETGRMFYVYAAEIVLTLLFLHVYLTNPQLFRGFFTRYWPFVAMGIAFAGVGVGELFQRMKLRVLADPLQRSGAFLALLPAIGFWVHQSEVEHSSVLFFVGLLYVVLSMWRGGIWYAVAAGVAGNAGLWALWHEHGTELFEHPQLWLIPPALSVLAAAQWHRKQLAEAQLTGIRYLCMIVIYVSSTGDMFITGVAESLWMPMILAGLSVAGVFAGIMLRIRAFVYLGSSFLLLSMVSMVWHAARNIGHVWPWWAFGIALGLAILTFFGVFEKKRKEVLHLVGEFRQWDA